MSYESARQLTLPIAAAVAKGIFLKIDSSGNAVRATAVGDHVIAISAQDITAEDITNGTNVIAAVLPDGARVECKAGSVIVAGNGIGPHAGSGGGEVAQTAGDRIMGVALTGAAADEFFDMIFVGAGFVVQ